MAESTLPVAGCLSLRSAVGENIVVCRGKRPLQRNKCRFAEFGWYRGIFRPDLYNWDGFFILSTNRSTNSISIERHINLMKETLQKIKEEALAALSAADADIEALRIRYLGKKGELTAVLRGMGKLSPEERPIMGQLANEVRAQIEEQLTKRAGELKTAAMEGRLRREKLDVTVPGEKVYMGHLHPLTKTEEKPWKIRGH